MFTVKNHKLVCTTTPTEAKESFQELAALDSRDVYQKSKAWAPTHNSKALNGLKTPTPRRMGVLDTKRVGKEFSNYFSWRDRAAVAKPGQISINDLLAKWKRQPQQERVALARVQKYVPNKTHDDLVFYAARMGSAFMSVNMFPPCVSKFFADALDAQHVLDFSAGWLDRFAGFLAAPSVRTITLIDPRPGVPSYAKQMLRMSERPVAVKVFTNGAERVMPKLTNNSLRSAAPGNKFDLILTSPPYFDLEHYDTSSRNAKLQVMATCDSAEEYLSKFLFPVMDAAARLLKPNGCLVVNIDDNAKRGVDVCGPLLDHMAKSGLTFVGTMGLKKAVLANSTTNNKVNGRGAKGEPVYIWCKSPRCLDV